MSRDSHGNAQGHELFLGAAYITVESPLTMTIALHPY